MVDWLTVFYILAIAYVVVSLAIGWHSFVIGIEDAGLMGAPLIGIAMAIMWPLFTPMWIVELVQIFRGR